MAWNSDPHIRIACKLTRWYAEIRTTMCYVSHTFSRPVGQIELPACSVGSVVTGQVARAISQSGEFCADSRRKKTGTRWATEQLAQDPEKRPRRSSIHRRFHGKASPRQFGVETVLWVHAAKKEGKCYRGILEAAERFMVRLHVEEEQKSSERRAARIGDAQSRKGTGGTRETAVEERKKEAADRLAGHQAD